MARNVNSMKTKVALFDHMNSRVFNTTKDLKSGFHNLETSAYSKSREGKVTICVSAFEYGSMKFKYPAGKSTEDLFVKQQDLQYLQ